MPTANDELRDSIIRHQIFLLDTSESVKKRITKLIDQSEASIKSRLKLSLTTLVNDDGVNINKGAMADERVDILLKFIKELRNKSIQSSFDFLKDELQELISLEHKFASTVLNQSAPVILDLTIPSAVKLKTLVTKSPFQGKLLKEWASEIKHSDLNRISDEIKIGLTLGESVSDIVSRILGTSIFKNADGATATTRRQMTAITRTAINHFSTQARKEVFNANADIIEIELYTATLDSRTTLICGSLDGKQFKVDKGPYPPIHFNCRSVRVAVFDNKVIGERPAKSSTEKQLLREFSKQNNFKKTIVSKNEIPHEFETKFKTFSRKRIRELTGRVPASQNYTTFLKNQSVSFQNDRLGITRAKLFRKGQLQLDKFVTKQGREFSIKELALREKDAFIKAGLKTEDFK